MKTNTIILAVIAMLLGVFSANATATESATSVNVENATEIAPSYSFVANITAYKFSGRGGISIKTHGSAKLYEKDGNYYAFKNGNYYRVRSSNRDGYDYMFYDDYGTWYFNY